MNGIPHSYRLPEGRQFDNIKANLVRYQIVGTLFIISFGSVLHFLLDWSGGWTPVALIAPVNESVWEHLKMVFWPGLIFVLITYPMLKNKTANFWTASIAGLLSMPLIILGLFYSYKVIFHAHNLAFDIGIFILAVFFGQWLNYRMLLKPRAANKTRYILVGLLLVALVLFSLCSYFPPPYPLFQDSHTGQYGIPESHFRR
jgi:hypothetical protein